MNSPPKILIINLTRLGDILQSTPLLRALKSHDPAGEIQYLAVDRFAEVCRHIPEIDEVIPFSFDSALAVSKDAVRQLPRRLKEVEDFVQSLRHRNFDTVINLSHSRISALICHLLNVQDTRGLTLDREGFRQIRQPWANYFFTANLNRTFNRFNLVDVNLGLAWAEGSGAEAKNVPWTAGGGSLSFQISPDARLQARQLLKSDNDCAARLRIGFQPGASLPNKRWPTDSFVELGKLLKDSCKAQIAIFGSKAEVGLGEAIEQSLNGEILNFVGKTNIPLLGALLQELDLLISNDTGTQHLAAAVGTPVLSLCFGSALSHETGPYGRGHLIVEPTLACFPCSFHVECPRFRCQEQVKPEAVLQIALARLTAEDHHSPAVPDNSLFDDLQVWRTDFDHDGFWMERPLFRRSLRADDLSNLAGRWIWKKTLTENDGAANDLEADGDFVEMVAQDYCHAANQSFADDVARSWSALSDLRQTAQSGAVNCLFLRDRASSPAADLDEIRRLGLELSEVDRAINLCGANHPEVNSLCLDFNWGKQNLQGKDLVGLAIQSEKLYRRLDTLAARYELGLRRALMQLGYSVSAFQSSKEVCHACA